MFYYKRIDCIVASWFPLCVVVFTCLAAFALPPSLPHSFLYLPLFLLALIDGSLQLGRRSLGKSKQIDHWLLVIRDVRLYALERLHVVAFCETTLDAGHQGREQHQLRVPRIIVCELPSGPVIAV